MASLTTRYGPRAARAVRLLRRPATYAGLGRELLWTRFPTPLAPLEPTWPLAAQDRARAVVTWPHSSPWPAALRWTETLRDGLGAHVELRHGDIAQRRENMVVFELSAGKGTHPIAIDYADSNEVDEAVARSVPLYFKLQHSVDGYPWPSVVPGGYIAGQSRLAAYLRRLRDLRDADRSVYDVYGRFGAYGLPIRERVVADLSGREDFAYHGSLGTVLYVESMREVARARVCIDLPGRGAFCYRLVDYLAVGSAIVAVPHTNRLHVPLEPGKHLLYAGPDAGDVGDLCRELLDDPARRHALVERSRDFYDRFLEPRQLASYYLTTALERLR